MAKNLNITDMLNETVAIKGRGYAVAGDGGVTETPVSKYASVDVSKQPMTGVTDSETIGKPIQDCDWYMITSDNLPLVLNGDIVVDANSVSYSIQYHEYVNSAIGSYFAMWCKEIRE